MVGSGAPGLDRRVAVAALLASRGEALVVSGLGSPSWDVHAAGDVDANYYLWGAMGGAALVGLGVALAQPERRVMVVTGDGEQLMALGSLATIAVAAPSNLEIHVLDNERYGETGMQLTTTATGTDLAAVADACGFHRTMTATSDADLGEGVAMARSQPGPVLVVFKVAADVPPQVVPPRDGRRLVDRFRNAVASNRDHGHG